MIRTSDTPTLRGVVTVVVVIGVCAWHGRVRAATEPVRAASAGIGRVTLSAAAVDPGSVVVSPHRPRGTGVCDPPVGRPEPIPCASIGACTDFGPGTCGINGRCDYAPITTCGSSDDCVGKGTAKRLSRRCGPPKSWPAAGSIRVFMLEALVMTDTFDVTDTGT